LNLIKGKVYYNHVCVFQFNYFNKNKKYGDEIHTTCNLWFMGNNKNFKEYDYINNPESFRNLKESKPGDLEYQWLIHCKNINKWIDKNLFERIYKLNKLSE